MDPTKTEAEAIEKARASGLPVSDGIVAMIREAFVLLDKNGDGAISVSEFASFLSSIGRADEAEVC